MARARTVKLYDNLYLIRVEDDETGFFEALWEIPEGVTYNSYLILGQKRTVLLDTVKKPFTLDYLEALSSITELRDIDVIVVHHSEPDHSGALPELLKRVGNVEVYGHPMAKTIIESHYGVKLNSFKPVREGARLDLGGDEYLVFYQTPWVHWPDTVMSFYEARGVLFSGDVFGSYSIPSSVTDEHVEDFTTYIRFMRKYLATVAGRYRSWILKTLDKLENAGVKPKTIAPLHGLVLRRYIGDFLRLYRSWVSGDLDKSRAVVIYGSMYGAVEYAAHIVADMLREKGLHVAIYGFNDKSRALIADAIGDAFDAGYIVLGVPTYEAEAFPLMTYVAEQLCAKAAAGQRVMLLSSYGWGPAAIKKLEPLLTNCGFKIAARVEVRGVEYGDKLREAVEKLLAG
ncbi:FprA family A-type flavoprotein [Hyperthermus butylicus]|uniref:Flavoprotein n=1 Tax=Hyperthermus butylicus (strain DSM 5456 / JCM 9403 / PLM1-5) TaxID=415426 RepID=A2BN01_HYPBU|nr:FprA family A-type flavoprotein [Hyperthermus butylicus]ABM81362.1 putative flavoprotein [Hyperthermus butylicus DSM 5456]